MVALQKAAGNTQQWKRYTGMNIHMILIILSLNFNLPFF